MNLESHLVDIHGLHKHYVSAGSGPVVIQLHGFADTHQIWRKQIPALVAAAVRVIAPDMRGCGGTDAPAVPAPRPSTSCAPLSSARGIAWLGPGSHWWGKIGRAGRLAAAR